MRAPSIHRGILRGILEWRTKSATTGPRTRGFDIRQKLLYWLHCGYGAADLLPTRNLISVADRNLIGPLAFIKTQRHSTARRVSSATFTVGDFNSIPGRPRDESPETFPSTLGNSQQLRLDVRFPSLLNHRVAPNDLPCSTLFPPRHLESPSMNK